MAELNRKQHVEAAGQTWSAAPYFGGFIQSLGGLYVPGQSAQSEPSAHYSETVNLLDAMHRRFGAAFPGYIYKDSADAEDEFSVRAFTLQHRGHACAYAGQTARGPLVVGVNKVWADLSAAPTVSISFGSAWPTVPHAKLGEIDMPAAGHWLPDDLTALVNSQALMAVGAAVHPVRFALAFGTAAAPSLGFVPAGAIVAARGALVVTAFDGAAPTIKIGDGVDDDSLVETADVDLTSIGFTPLSRAKLFSAQTEIVAAYVADSSAAGAAYLLFEQW